MLQICPKCHSAYNVNDKCPHCSFWERNNELLKLVEVYSKNNDFYL